MLPPYRDELLSSWIIRHAAFYAISPKDVLRHCLGEAMSLRTVDLRLREDQLTRLGYMFATEVAYIRRMTFVNVAPHLHRFISPVPVHACTRCSVAHTEPRPVFRGEFTAWRVTCKACGDFLVHPTASNSRSPVSRYIPLALHGEHLIDEEVERGVRTWASPTAIARLLLMRRLTFCAPGAAGHWRARMLSSVIPDLDDVCCGCDLALPSPAYPIMPIHLRSAWLAGVATVEQAGPAMLDILRSQMLNNNPIDFGETSRKPVFNGVTNLTRQWQIMRESASSDSRV